MAAKSDLLRKPLVAAGLGPDAAAKYIDVLRDFLSARTNKQRFEAALRAIIPPDKIHVHNAIIHDLLERAVTRRDGFRDLPVLIPPRRVNPGVRRDQPVVSKRVPHKSDLHRSKQNALKRHAPSVSVPTPHDEDPSASQPLLPAVMNAVAQTNTTVVSTPAPPVNTSSAIPAATPVLPPLSQVREPKVPVPAALTTMRKPPASDDTAPLVQPPTKRAKLSVPARRKDETLRVKSEPEKPSPRVKPARGRRDLSNSGGGAAGRPTEIETYDSLGFTPVQSGQALDYELFFRLRARLRAAGEAVGLGVRDDAVGLMTVAVEQRVRQLIEAGLMARAATTGRARGLGACVPLASSELRDAALGGGGGLMSGDMLELERLTMLL